MLGRILLALVATAGTAAGQGVGVVGGLGVVDFDDAGASNSRLKPRPVIGAFVRLPLADLHLDVGAQYARRRVDWTICASGDCNDPFASDGTWVFDDLEVPVMLRLPIEAGRVRVVPHFGVVPWFVLRKRRWIEDEPRVAGTDVEHIRGWDVAFAGGIGIDWQVGRVRYGVELRGSLGLTKRVGLEDDARAGETYAGYALFTSVLELQ